MGYTIQYTAFGEVEYSREKEQKKRSIAPAMFFLVIIICVCIVRYIRNDVIHDFFIPGNAEVTKAAFTELTDSVQQGIPVREAITAFCREIIENA